MPRNTLPLGIRLHILDFSGVIPMYQAGGVLEYYFLRYALFDKRRSKNDKHIPSFLLLRILSAGYNLMADESYLTLIMIFG